jgi:peptide/nickel transport system substrate-binding protein
LAESIEPRGGRADTWIVRLKPGIEFHDGKTVDADDVIYSIKRIVDPSNPKTGAASIGYVNTKGLRKLDKRTVEVPLRFANIGFPDDIGQYFNGIVPAGYDPKRPVGTGPFKYESFTPGQQSTFVKFPNYHQTGRPYLDEVVIVDFADDTARVNALLAGQVNCISSLPPAQLQSIQSNSALRPLISHTGGWLPFTMRVDQAPFSDVRVRQAMRLIVDRPQMIEQALTGQGRVANDLFSPFDPAYNSSLPQRHQDIDQAKSLLKQAGRSNLAIELVTAPVYEGLVSAAQVFAQQAKAAGVTVNLRQVDSGTFFGPNYLKWPFAQDFWGTYQYLPQVAQCSLPNSPFNETHWSPPRFQQLISQARAQLDKAKRIDILHEAQMLQWNEGGYIVWGFDNLLDAYSAKLSGFTPAKSGFPLGNYGFKEVGFTA